jgi:hypothetical protein
VNKNNSQDKSGPQPIELSTNVTKFSSISIEEEGAFNVSAVNPDESQESFNNSDDSLS